MPLVCFAPGCRSGYASERRTGAKHHYFRLPKDEELCKIWKCKIRRADREMAAHDVLCDIHFDPKDVVTHDVFTINGETVKVARERYKLVTGAQPIHFPNPTNKTRTLRKKKIKPTLRKTTRKILPKIVENSANVKINPKTQETDPDVTKLLKLQRKNASLRRLLQAKRKKYTKVMNDLKQRTDALATAKSQLKLYKPTTRKTQLWIKEFVRKETRRTKTIRYHKDSILDCVLFRVKSPDGYLHCLRHGLAPQPSKASYSRLLGKLRCDFRKNNDSIEILAGKLTNKSQDERLGVLALREIEIHEAVDSSGTNMQFDGFVNYAGATSEKADKGLIFVFKSLVGGWNLVITRYALRNETPGYILAKLCLEIIINAENAGARVIALLSNGGEANQSAVRSLRFDGRSGSLKNSVPHPCEPDTRRLFCLYDVRGVFKRIQDHFETRRKCQFLNWNLDFKYVELAKPEVTKRRSELHKANPFEFFSQLRNRLRNCGKMKRGCQDLEEFTCYFSRLGDILNSDGLRQNSDNHKFLMDVDNTLRSVEATNNTVMSTKTLECLRLSICSLLNICNFLWARGIIRICAGKLNQV